MTGNHTKPKTNSRYAYWVITNTNSGRKMLMLEGAMQSMDLPESLIDEVRAYFTEIDDISLASICSPTYVFS